MVFLDPLNDGFEDGLYSGTNRTPSWTPTLYGGTVNVDSDSKKTGSYGIHFTHPNADPNSTSIETIRSAQTGSYMLWAQHKKDGVLYGRTQSQYGLKTTTGSWLFIMTIDHFDNKFNIYNGTSTIQNGVTINKDLWYKMLAIYTDNDETGNFYLLNSNDSIISSHTGISITNAVGTVGSIRLNLGGKDTEAYYDDVTYGGEESNPPTVNTISASNITIINAYLTGSISNDGNDTVTTRGFAVGTSLNPSSSGTIVSETGSYGIGPFSGTITSLDWNTGYFYRAYAVNSKGTGYGNNGSFNTLDISYPRRPSVNIDSTQSSVYIKRTGETIG